LCLPNEAPPGLIDDELRRGVVTGPVGWPVRVF
jgi:hypothetical protein